MCFQNAREYDCSSIAISPDDRKVASISSTHNIFTIWDVETEVAQQSDPFMQPPGIYSFVFSPDSESVLVAKHDLWEWAVRGELVLSQSEIAG